MKYQRYSADPNDVGNFQFARIFYPDGRVYGYTDQKLACSVYLALSRGTRAAFRGIGDNTPVYSHDYVDRV